MLGTLEPDKAPKQRFNWLLEQYVDEGLLRKYVLMDEVRYMLINPTEAGAQADLIDRLVAEIARLEKINQHLSEENASLHTYE